VIGHTPRRYLRRKKQTVSSYFDQLSREVRDAADQHEEESTDKRARILTCADDMSPVILEVARKADFPDFKTFRDTVQGLPFQFDGTILTYTSLGNDHFKFFADQSDRPQINGTPIDLGPEKVYDSPFVQSDWNSGVVTIQFGDKKCVLDFNGE